jgi:hypothetical protein
MDAKQILRDLYITIDTVYGNAALDLTHKHNKIILTLMIKNESKIIARCIQNSIYMVDAISILDTGSTDNTIELCNKILLKYGKPYNISVEEFKNFGHNRSVSFLRAQEFCKTLGWGLETTYVLAVDADMIIKPSNKFQNFKLTENGYKIIQKHGNIVYYNIRFMKCSYDWKCIGATHEYWSGDPTGKIDQDIIYIDDISDGGCKSDKSERDIRLLNEDIENGKNLDRSHFYLAQTLKDTGKHELAIETYKKRIELGGWFEEIWYSYYQIGKCFLELKKPIDMEYWMNKAFNYNKNRSEPLYFLTKYYRETSQHYKAYHYYLIGKDIKFPHNQLLFIEHNIYNGLFDYESTILSCNLCKKRQDVLCELITYINKKIKHHIGNVWDNLYYYVETLTCDTYRGNYIKYNFPDIDEYKASSCALLAKLDLTNTAIGDLTNTAKYILNVRMVNYSIDEKRGSYHMRHPNNKVMTKNAVVYLDAQYNQIGNPYLLVEDCMFFDKNIEGLEDVRIFYFQNDLYMIASSKNITNNDNIDLVIGKYSITDKKIHDVSPIKSHNNSRCEKNWIFIPETAELEYAGAKGKINFVYGWYPLEIASLEIGDTGYYLTSHTKYNNMPELFSRFRGSSNMVEYNNRYYTVAHFVKYSTPRVYYHSLVIFDKMIKLVEYSAPFYFRQNKIEYCLGFDIKKTNNKIICAFIFSENDSNPGLITIPFEHLKITKFE